MTPAQRWIGALFLAAILTLFTAEVFYHYEPVKLGAVLIVFFWIPLLALHEASHAVVAAALGWNVGQVVIGIGRTMYAFRVGNAMVELRLVPVEGFVKCVPSNMNLPRLKSGLIYFAGPGVELLLPTIILLLAGPDRLLCRSEDYLTITLQSLAAAAAVQGVVNLIPYATHTPRGDIANDGLGILRCFFLPDSRYREMIGQTYNEKERDWEPYDPADWWKRKE